MLRVPVQLVVSGGAAPDLHGAVPTAEPCSSAQLGQQQQLSVHYGDTAPITHPRPPSGTAEPRSPWGCAPHRGCCWFQPSSLAWTRGGQCTASPSGSRQEGTLGGYRSLNSSHAGLTPDGQCTDSGSCPFLPFSGLNLGCVQGWGPSDAQFTAQYSFARARCLSPASPTLPQAGLSHHPHSTHQLPNLPCSANPLL